jgi:hypothetical protein
LPNKILCGDFRAVSGKVFPYNFEKLIRNMEMLYATEQGILGKFGIKLFSSPSMLG